MLVKLAEWDNRIVLNTEKMFLFSCKYLIKFTG